MRRVLVAALLVIGSSTSVCQDKTRRDGNWWVDQTPVARVNYVIGFFDGVPLGRDFSWWGCSQEDKTKCLETLAPSYTKFEAKFLAGITGGQLSDGLDVFYKDYRNRRIRIRNAVWLVLNGIAGTPQGDVDKLTETFRSNAPND